MQGARPDHNNSNYLRILYFNARSLYPKYDELCALSEVEKPNIICITESWLHDGIPPSECYIPGYTCATEKGWIGHFTPFWVSPVVQSSSPVQ